MQLILTQGISPSFTLSKFISAFLMAWLCFCSVDSPLNLLLGPSLMNELNEKIDGFIECLCESNYSAL